MIDRQYLIGLISTYNNNNSYQNKDNQVKNDILWMEWDVFIRLAEIG